MTINEKNTGIKISLITKLPEGEESEIKSTFFSGLSKLVYGLGSAKEFVDYWFSDESFSGKNHWVTIEVQSSGKDLLFYPKFTTREESLLRPTIELDLIVPYLTEDIVTALREVTYPTSYHPLPDQTDIKLVTHISGDYITGDMCLTNRSYKLLVRKTAVGCSVLARCKESNWVLIPLGDIVYDKPIAYVPPSGLVIDNFVTDIYQGVLAHALETALDDVLVSIIKGVLLNEPN